MVFICFLDGKQSSPVRSVETKNIRSLQPVSFVIRASLFSSSCVHSAPKRSPPIPQSLNVDLLNFPDPPLAQCPNCPSSLGLHKVTTTLPFNSIQRAWFLANQ